jgi:membrane-associated phospholipid phosphatase
LIKLIKNNIPFFTILLLFIVSVSSILYTFGKDEAQLFANKYHNDFADYFFFYMSQVIEGIIAPIILLIIITFKNFKYGVIILAAYLFSGAVTQFLKLVIYSEAKRPNFLMPELRLIPESFELHNRIANSFPSGHTTAAFSMFLILTLIVKNKKWGYFFALMAAGVAYARVYLSQHFFEDILLGSIIGTFVSLLVYYILDKYSFGKLSQLSLLGKTKSTNLLDEYH